MAEFGLSAAHESLRRAAQRFAIQELAPGAKERARDNRIPAWMFKKMAELGYIGITADKKYGGQGLDMMSAGVVIEEFARVDLAAPHVVLTPTQFCILLESGTEEQRQTFMPPLCRGEAIYSLALTEPGCGTDAGALKTKAQRNGDSYVIDGEKTPVTRAMQGDGAFVFAKTNPDAGAKGISCIYVPLDSPGVSRSEMPYAGMIPLNCAAVFFDSVKVPVSNRVGEEGKGLRMIMQRFDVLRVLLCLVVLAQAQTSLNEVMEYSKERIAFGKPIAKNEGVSFKFAEAATKIDAARVLCYKTLWMCDRGMVHSKESAMCKWYAPVVAFEAIQSCIVTMGHYGYSTESPLVQRMLDVMGYQIADGTAEAQKLVIVREMLGREFLPYS